MASIFKRSQDRRRKDMPYLISYNDESGKRRTVTGCTDLAATREIANHLASEARLRRRGVIDRAKERCSVVADHRDAKSATRHCDGNRRSTLGWETCGFRKF